MASKSSGIIGTLLRRVGDSLSARVEKPTGPLAAEGFGLISIKPFVQIDCEGRGIINFKKPFTFQVEVSTVEKETLTAQWGRESYSCADDICMLASILPRNMEVVAAGSQYTLADALLEASRLDDAATAKYIVFAHRIQRAHGRNAVVLENLVAPPGAKHVLVIILDRSPSELAKSYGLTLA